MVNDVIFVRPLSLTLARSHADLGPVALRAKLAELLVDAQLNVKKKSERWRDGINMDEEGGCGLPQQKAGPAMEPTADLYSHAAAGGDLASVSVPRDLRLRETADARRWNHGAVSLGDRLGSLTLLEASHNCRHKDRKKVERGAFPIPTLGSLPGSAPWSCHGTRGEDQTHRGTERGH